MLPKAYCINLDKDDSKMRQIYKDWSHLLDIERFSAVKASDTITGREACAKSHQEVYRKIAKLNVPFCIIMEDDVYCTKNFDKRLWDRIIWFSGTQSGWDMISLDPVLGFDCKVVTKFNGLFCTIEKFRGTGMIIYKTDFVRKHLNSLTNFKGAIDMTVTHNPSFIKLTPCKLIVRQYTDKPSATSLASGTTHYDRFWDETEKILLEASLSGDSIIPY